MSSMVDDPTTRIINSVPGFYPIKTDRIAVVFTDVESNNTGYVSGQVTDNRFISNIHDFDKTPFLTEGDSFNGNIPIECDVEVSIPTNEHTTRRKVDSRRRTSDAQAYSKKCCRKCFGTKPQKSVSFGGNDKHAHVVLQLKHFCNDTQFDDSRRGYSVMDNVTSWMLRNKEHFGKNPPESPTAINDKAGTKNNDGGVLDLASSQQQLRNMVNEDTLPEFDVTAATVICSEQCQKALTMKRSPKTIPQCETDTPLYENVVLSGQVSKRNNSALKDLGGLLVNINKNDLGSHDHSGWLQDQKTGKSVWCVLSGILFSIFTNETDLKPVDTLPLPACDVEAVTLREKFQTNRQSRSLRAFVIDCEILARLHCLIVGSESELLAWLCLLNIAARRDVGQLASLKTRYTNNKDHDNYQKNAASESVEDLTEYPHDRIKGKESSVPVDIHFKSPVRTAVSSTLNRRNKKQFFLSGSLKHIPPAGERQNGKMLSRESHIPMNLHGKSKSCSNLLFSNELFPSVVNLKKFASERDVRQSNKYNRNDYSRVKFTSTLAKRAVCLKELIFGRRNQNHVNDLYVGTLMNVKVNGYLFYKNLLKWQTLWCAVSKSYFYGFKSRKSYEKPVLILPLVDSAIIHVSALKGGKPKTSKRNVFKITTAKNRSVYMGSSDSMELYRWLQVLHMEANRIQVDTNEWKTRVSQSVNRIDGVNQLIGKLSGSVNEDGNDAAKNSYRSASSPAPNPSSATDSCSTCSTICSSALDTSSGSHDDQTGHYDNALRHVWENDEHYRLKKLRVKIRRERIAEVLAKGIVHDELRRRTDDNVLIVQENSLQRAGLAHLKVLNSSGSSAAVSSTEEDGSSVAEVDYCHINKTDMHNKRPKPPTVRTIRADTFNSVDCSGYMQKRQKNGQCIRFWYVLEARRLYCYLSPDDEITADIISLTDWSLSMDGDTSKQPNVLKLSHPKWVTHQLITATQGEYQLWSYVIQQASEGLERTSRKVQGKELLASKLTESYPLLGGVTHDQEIRSISLSLPMTSQMPRIPGRRQIADKLGYLTAQNHSTENAYVIGRLDKLGSKGNDVCMNDSTNFSLRKADQDADKQSEELRDLQQHRDWVEHRIATLQNTLTLSSQKTGRKIPFLNLNRRSKADRIRTQTAESEIRYLVCTLVNIDQEMVKKAAILKEIPANYDSPSCDETAKPSDPVYDDAADEYDDFCISTCVHNQKDFAADTDNCNNLSTDSVFSCDENNNNIISMSRPNLSDDRFGFVEITENEYCTIPNDVGKSSSSTQNSLAKLAKLRKKKTNNAIFAFDSCGNDFHRSDESRDLREFQALPEVMNLCNFDNDSSSDMDTEPSTGSRGTQTTDPSSSNPTRRMTDESLASIQDSYGDIVSRKGVKVTDRGTQTLYTCIAAEPPDANTQQEKSRKISPEVLAEIEAFEELSKQKLCQLASGI